LLNRNPFLPKIKLGILKLRRLGENELANHYKKEANKLGYSGVRNMFKLLLMIIALFAFWYFGMGLILEWV
jgi:hypothetical protein